MAQPIIRGIQAVGAVDIQYQYNSSGNLLSVPSSIQLGENNQIKEIDTSSFVQVAGFRLDGEFLRAVQQIASSVQVPILGGGAVALTNNNRSGTLSITATRVSTPDPDKDNGKGKMYTAGGLGPVGSDTAYDLTLLAQIQQAQEGGDSVGATIKVIFQFCGLYTIVSFQGCTVASIDPLGLAGNDAANYNIQFNYLNWEVVYSSSNSSGKPA